MVPPKMPLKLTKSQLTLLEDGLILEKSNLPPLREAIGDTCCQKKKKKVKKLYMLECPLRNKNQISTDKFNSLEKNILHIKLSQTSPPESTLNAKDLHPFWRKSLEDKYQKLWLPRKTESHDLDLIYSNLSLNSSIPHSWLKTVHQQNPQNKNSPKTSYLSLQSLPQNSMDPVNTKRIKVGRKIRFYPSTKLKLYFKQCFGVYRFFYNKAIKYFDDTYKDKCEEIDELFEVYFQCCHYENGEYCRKDIYPDYGNTYFCKEHLNEKLNFGTTTNFIDLRGRLLTPNKELIEEDKWQQDVPYDLRQLAIKDACSALKTCLTNKIRGNIDKFQLGFKSKKMPNQIFKITNTFINLNKKKMFSTYKFSLRTKMNKWVKKRIDKLNDTITIQKEGDKYYFCATFDVDYEIPKIRPFNCVSLDPGVRTFLTLYSSDGVIGKLGDNIVDGLTQKGEKVDKLQSLIKKGNFTSKTKRKMKLRCSLLRTKIRNIVTDLHWKSINFLCLNFRTIIIPNFDVTSKVKKLPERARKINNKTVRQMLTLSHGKFLERLHYYGNKSETEIIESTEEYTSKTCGKCGKIDEKLGSKKNYKCKNCGYYCDRDINGARNIKLLALGRGLDPNPKKVV